MAAERASTSNGNDDEFDKIIAGQFPELSEEYVIGHINALEVFRMIEQKGINMSFYRDQLKATPPSQNVFSAISEGIASGLLHTDEEPKTVERRTGWLRSIANMLPANTQEKEAFDAEGAELPPGRVRDPYESKIAMQIDVAREGKSNMLSAEWQSALVAVIDEIAPGISLADFDEDERNTIIHDGEVRGMKEELVRIYEKYAIKTLKENLEAYAGHEDFGLAITGLAKALANSYVPQNIGGNEEVVSAHLTFAGYHLQHMGLTSDHEDVQLAIGKAEEVLKNL